MARGFVIFDGLASQHPPMPEGSIVSRFIVLLLTLLKGENHDNA